MYPVGKKGYTRDYVNLFSTTFAKRTYIEKNHPKILSFIESQLASREKRPRLALCDSDLPLDLCVSPVPLLDFWVNSLGFRYFSFLRELMWMWILFEDRFVAETGSVSEDGFICRNRFTYEDAFGFANAAGFRFLDV